MECTLVPPVPPPSALRSHLWSTHIHRVHHSLCHRPHRYTCHSTEPTDDSTQPTDHTHRDHRTSAVHSSVDISGCTWSTRPPFWAPITASIGDRTRTRKLDHSWPVAWPRAGYTRNGQQVTAATSGVGARQVASALSNLGQGDTDLFPIHIIHNRNGTTHNSSSAVVVHKGVWRPRRDR